MQDKLQKMPYTQNLFAISVSNLRTLFGIKNYFCTFLSQKEFAHTFFVAKTICALRPESFCAYNRKTFLNCPNTFKTIRICHDDFWIISKLSGFFQIIANFLDDFKSVWNFPDDCQFKDYLKTVWIFPD